MDKDSSRQPANRTAKAVARVISFAQITCFLTVGRTFFVREKERRSELLDIV